MGLVAVSLLLIAVMVATPVIACAYCKSSPDGKFGFCRFDAERGYNDCTEYVTDSFNGNTWCNLDGNNCPYGPGDYRPGGGGGGGSDDSDCWWPGLTGGCIMY